MTTGFSFGLAKTILENAKNNPDNKMLKLGSLCIETDTPLSAVAEYFGVSRQSVYGWMAGSFEPRQDKVLKADKLIAKLQKKLDRKQQKTAAN